MEGAHRKGEGSPEVAGEPTLAGTSRVLGTGFGTPTMGWANHQGMGSILVEVPPSPS